MTITAVEKYFFFLFLIEWSPDVRGLKELLSAHVGSETCTSASTE